MNKLVVVLFTFESLVSFGRLHTAYNEIKYPEITISETKGGTYVFWGDELLLELRENRRLRFRATPQNDHWVASERKPMDLCWAYADAGVNDYVPKKVTCVNDKQLGKFQIDIIAEKPSVTGTVTIKIEGIWNPEQQEFRYLLSSRLQCPLEEWYLNSNGAMKVYNVNPKGRPNIEAVDYHMEHISLPDINTSSWPDHKILYNCQVFSENGKNWTILPKVHIPYVVRPGDYNTISTPKLNTGCFFGSIDFEEGGWMSRIVETPVQMLFSQCWMFFDVHVYMENAVPSRYSQQELDLTCNQEFKHIGPDEVQGIIANSEEVEWKTKPEYQLPVFSRNNTFDQLITDSGNKEKHMWWASSYDCSRVTDTGFDDNYSVTINHGTKDKQAAWYQRCWGYPYDQEKISGLYRVRAKVKTIGCTGKVRLAVAQTSDDYWIHSSRFDRDGAQWTYSLNSLSGTNDWTDLEVTVRMVEPLRHIVLEHLGPGQSWFDNVVIEKVYKKE